MADFSDLGGVPVQGSAPAKGPDFSDLGGVPVEPEQSHIESAARGALRNFPLAQQAGAALAPINPFADKGNYSDELQHLTQAAEAGKVQNPKSYLAGAAAGTVAPLLIPGVGEAVAPLRIPGVAEALEAAPMAGNAALGAAQSASDVNMTKPTLKDVGNTVLGAGLGAGAGWIGKGISALAPSAEELAANSTAKGFGATARNVGKIMGDNPNAELTELGNWANRVRTPDGEPLVSLAQRPGKMLTALNEIHDAAGKSIGEVINKVAPDIPVSVSRLRQDLVPILEEVKDINPQAEAKIGGIFKRLSALEDSGKLDFNSLQKLKSNIGANMGDEPAMQRAYGVLADYMDKVIDGYSQYIKDPELYQKFAGSRLDYRNASKILPILRRAEGRELAQGPAGNGGLLGLFGLAAGVAGGHPVAGALAMPANAVARPIGNMLGRNLGLKMAPAMPAIAETSKRLSQAAQLELANALEKKFGQSKP